MRPGEGWRGKELILNVLNMFFCSGFALLLVMEEWVLHCRRLSPQYISLK